jgi:tetratricopeptide (TPR) repeat protein
VSARAILTALGLVALGYLATVRGPVSASLLEAQAALREGRYAEAVESFEKEAVANPTPRLYRGWVEALRLTGAHDDALSVIQRFESREPASVALSNARGEILYQMGRIAEAREAFEKAVAGRAPDALTAELNLAVLLYEEGSVDEAIARFDRFIDVYNRS